VLSHNPDSAKFLRTDEPHRARNAERWGLPSSAASTSALRADLVLSGHTHGGQICLPSTNKNRGTAVLYFLVWLDRVLPRFLGTRERARRVLLLCRLLISCVRSCVRPCVFSQVPSWSQALPCDPQLGLGPGLDHVRAGQPRHSGLVPVRVSRAG
jgi:hypothetical protein